VHQRVTRGVRRLTQPYRITRIMSGEIGNLVVKVDVKENVEEGPTMANTELLEAWVSSSKANLVSDKLNGLSGLLQGYPSYLGTLSAKIILSQGGRPMRKFSGEAS
jgi:hypothetical protein